MTPKIVFSDFDGTLTQGTQMSPVFFKLIDLLREREIPLVVVTGRSQAWGHFLLTHFPLDVAITEGGGCLTRRHGHRLRDEFLVSLEEREELEQVGRKIPKEFPGLYLSADSQGRQTDRAIELDDLKPKGLKARVEDFLKKEGVNFSCSNVHMNFWKGDFDKFQASKHYLEQDWESLEFSDCLFFGDSLNDESMFQHFPSVGVSNIAHILEQFQHRPQTVLQGVENAGPHGVFNYLKKQLN